MEIFRSGDHVIAVDLEKEAENIKKLPGVDKRQVDELVKAAKAGQGDTGKKGDDSSDGSTPQEFLDRLKKAVEDRHDYETVKDSLIIRPLNYQRNREKLSGCMYRQTGDVALALYQLLGERDHTIHTSRIEKKDLHRWNMDGQKIEILDDALRNTARIYPPCVYSRVYGDAVNFLSHHLEKDDIMFLNQVILLSTFETTNGAAALFYPGVREKMLEIIGGPFYAVFMNINDVAVLEMDNPMLQYWLRTAGKSSVLGDYLSDKCYMCDKEGIAPVGKEKITK